LGAVVALLNVADGTSRVHASRRVFQALKDAGVTIPVVHHIRFGEGAVRDEIVINTGSMVRASWAPQP
jgi:(E)-4-hydroxy-3-methylbut-2-enyl-diphosphate synthase